MQRRNRPDSLLLFLIFSLVLLIIIFPVDTILPKASTVNIETKLDISKNIDLPNQGQLKAAHVDLLNPNLQLEISINGGEDFNTVKSDSFNLLEIENPKITYRNTSIRWRQPKGEFPYLNSFVLRLRDKTKNSVSVNTTFTCFDSITTKIPIISININESALFGWNNGLMIYGRDANYDFGFNKEWWYRSANFKRRGAESKAIVEFQYFEEGKLLISRTSEFKISGNATRYFPQKSFRLKPFDKQNDKFDYPFWGKLGNKKSKSIVLRNSGNDNTRTMFADILMHRLAVGGEILTQQGKPTMVFFNGNYWGIYNIRERIDSYFIAKHIGSKSKDITILETGNALLKDGSQKEKERFDLFIEKLKTNSSSDNVTLIRDNINIENFYEYIFYETFYANNDWPVNNCILFSSDGGKWNWILNDLDYSLAYPGEDNVRKNWFMKSLLMIL